MNGRRRRWLAFILAAAMPAAGWAASDIDQQIEAAARQSLPLRVILQQRVDVQSDDGVVTLRGTVQDLDQKALAEEVVRAIEGVQRVENDLEVQFPGRERGDGWLELKIRGMLLLRPEVSVRHTRVNVTDGVVTLSGVAQSETQREMIEAMARNIEGVKDVRNELRVRTASELAESEFGRAGAL